MLDSLLQINRCDLRAINKDIGVNQILKCILSSKAFCQIITRRKEGEVGELLSADSPAQIDQKNLHLLFSAPGEAF